MWRMRVVHETGYAYKGPVTASYNEARLTPRSDSRQNVIINRVETAPATRSYRYVDYWGTLVTAFDLHAPHIELEVTSSSVVETDKSEPVATTLDWDGVRSAAVADRYHEYLIPTEHTPASKRIDRVAAQLVKGRDPREAVLGAVEWVRGQVEYTPGSTGVHSSGLDALKEGQGVCQDFAHLTLILLRAMGIPGRYVSGYLHPKSDAEIGEAVEGESHAWIQAWTGSWWNYDPTNDTGINEQYVSVGYGRSYADVAPLKGIYLGQGSSDLDVVVEMTRLA